MIKKMITIPTRLDSEPYLTEWHADVEPKVQIWIQCSKDLQAPKWIRLGELYEEAVLKGKTNHLKDILD